MSKSPKRKLPLLSKILLALSAFLMLVAVYYNIKAYFGG